jgi:hypothetical protein
MIIIIRMMFDYDNSDYCSKYSNHMNNQQYSLFNQHNTISCRAQGIKLTTVHHAGRLAVEAKRMRINLGRDITVLLLLLFLLFGIYQNELTTVERVPL